MRTNTSFFAVKSVFYCGIFSASVIHGLRRADFVAANGFVIDTGAGHRAAGGVPPLSIRVCRCAYAPLWVRAISSLIAVLVNSGSVLSTNFHVRSLSFRAYHYEKNRQPETAMGRSGVAIKTGAVKAGKGRGFTGERTQGGSSVALPRVNDQDSGTTSTARHKPR